MRARWPGGGDGRRREEQLQQGVEGGVAEEGGRAEGRRARRREVRIGERESGWRRARWGPMGGGAREMGIKEMWIEGDGGSGACVLSWWREVSERRERWEMGIGLRY